MLQKSLVGPMCSLRRLQVLALAASVFSIPVISAQAEGTVYYVSPAGNDAWSGELAAPNDARTDGPFASIVRARDAIRQLRQDEGRLPGPFTVSVRGGKYYIGEPITFTASDAGSSGAPVRYAAYPGETPELIGGRLIAELEPDAEGRLCATLPRVRNGAW
jgi:hypothetical protein